LPEVICNTSPLQYLHQLGHLRLLPALAGRVIVPPAVVDELAVGRGLGVDLPAVDTLDWVTVRRPAGASAGPLITDLGDGNAVQPVRPTRAINYRMLDWRLEA
jgi:predicted nucleic acid-binding protein